MRYRSQRLQNRSLGKYPLLLRCDCFTYDPTFSDLAIGISSVRLPYCCQHGYHCILHASLLVAHWLLLIRQLLQANSNSAFRQTDTLITKPIVHTVETGVITVVTATIDLSLYLRYPNSYLHIFLYVPSRGSLAFSLTRIHALQGTYFRKIVNLSAFWDVRGVFGAEERP